MTNEEAIAYFKMRLADNHSEKATTQREAFALAIEALEKQTPKKPIARSSRECICGTCFRDVVGTGNYCWFCGQAIDWGEE